MGMILVVEDDADATGLIRWWLQEDGHRVLAVMTGERALEELAGSAFDLVLLDVRLPGLSGYEVLRRIREEALTDAPVMLVTITDADDIPADLETRTLAKPFTRETLQRAVRRALDPGV